MVLIPGLSDFSLTGQRALVVGAEHPVGRTAAVALVEAGAKVFLASQDLGAANLIAATVEAVNVAGQSNPPVQIQNATIRADINATVDRAVKELGGLEILVTALDELICAPIETINDAVLEQVWAANFKSVFLASQEVGQVMLRHGGGVMVHINSVMAERGVPNATLYCAAKAAVLNLVGSLALEWARRNIRVNLLECGWLDVPGSPATQEGEFSSRLVRYLPYRRLLKPDEIAGALLYLVSPASGFVTGTSIAVDGGLLCRV
jgi:2-deoxy-D-gluconate 3-dehydrogenase